MILSAASKFCYGNGGAGFQVPSQYAHVGVREGEVHLSIQSNSIGVCKNKPPRHFPNGVTCLQRFTMMCADPKYQGFEGGKARSTVDCDVYVIHAGPNKAGGRANWKHKGNTKESKRDLEGEDLGEGAFDPKWDLAYEW